MSNLEICRICLRTGCKMYRYDETYMYRYNSFKLKGYYEEIMGNKVILPDDLPSCFCYECAALLYKFHKFKIKCYNGQKTLKARLGTAGLITYAAIKNINREKINLVNLGVLKASKRVKTFIENNIESDTESLDDGEFDKNDDTETLDTELVKVESHAKAENMFHDEDSVEIEIKAKYSHINDTAFQYVLEKNYTADTTKSDKIKNETNEERKKCFDDNVNESIILIEDVQNSDGEEKKRRKGATDDENQTKIPKFAKKRRLLDSSLWKIYHLSEEDAWKEFRVLAEDPKYVAAEHKCGKCYTWFHTRDKLQRHNVLKHGSRGTIECVFCAIRFKFPKCVREHLQIHYKQFECLKCGMKTCRETSAVFHQDMHSGALRCCNYCGKSFKHSSTYYTHLRTHRSNFICNICGKSFVSESGLELHKKKTHCTQDGMDEKKSDDRDTSVNTFCKKCDMRFESRKAYIEHVFRSAAHDKADEDELEAEPDRPKRRKPLEAGATRKRKRNRNAAGEYSEPKKGTKPTTCAQCGQAFETQKACLKHHRKEHPRTTFYTDRYICEICGASLARGSIEAHMNKHTRKKTYTCDTCGRSFYAVTSLRIHAVVHTGEKRYKCPLCDKRFTQQGSMHLHYRTIHLKQPYPKRNRKAKDPMDMDIALEIASCSTD